MMQLMATGLTCSPWSMMMGGMMVVVAIGALGWLHTVYWCPTVMWGGAVIMMMFGWFMSSEAAEEELEYDSPWADVKGLFVFSVVLFLSSEVMFFSGFFWSMYHGGGENETFALGGGGVPVSIGPLVNTMVLILSGVSLTMAHMLLEEDKAMEGAVAMVITVFLGVLFTWLQYKEYTFGGMSGLNGPMGTTFYLLTGFHGFHVLLGTFFIVASGMSYFGGQHKATAAEGFEFVSWYWHFVDIVWVGLVCILYASSLANVYV